MEGVSATVYNGIKGYWRRKGYERLEGTGRRRKSRVELTPARGNSRRRKLFWKIKLTPRVKLKLNLRFSPKKFLIGLRDAYVRMMMRIANTPVIGTGIGGLAGEGVTEFGMRPIKEYDERMIVEIYKSILVAQGHLLPPGDASKIGSQIVCRR